jgi:hypothetical protein
MTSGPPVAMAERRLGLPDWITSLRRHVVASTVIATARVGTGLHARWVGCTPIPEQRIYFANHLSHGDFVLVWSALPPALRAKTRPVAGTDYWNRGRLRRFLAREVFNSVLIERGATGARRDPLQPIRQALDQASSLIVFPRARATRPMRPCSRSRAASSTSPAPILRCRWCPSGSRIRAALCPRANFSRSPVVQRDLRRAHLSWAGRAEGAFSIGPARRCCPWFRWAGRPHDSRL